MVELIQYPCVGKRFKKGYNNHNRSIEYCVSNKGHVLVRSADITIRENDTYSIIYRLMVYMPLT